MSFFKSTTAKILYVIVLGAVVYYATVQRMAHSGTNTTAPPSEPTGLAPAK
jgi:hypothetical protein